MKKKRVASATRLNSTRLQLLPFTSDDVDDLHRLFIEPGVRKYLWDDEVIAREQTAEIVDKSVASFEANGFGLWAVRVVDEAALAGFCGFWSFHDPPQIELLYGLSTRYWRRGLATEAALAMIAFGFEVLGFERIAASTDAANTASVRVMERAGMRFWKREMTNGLDTIYYVRTTEKLS
jgi:[ribosomal protein S5]-alanine N-acetyltransferase